MFQGVKNIRIVELGLSQLYLNADKLSNISKWFKQHDLSDFEPLPVHNFGNGRLTLTDGHSRAFIAYMAGLEEIPVIYDTDEMVTSKIGQLFYKNDIIWCDRFNLRNICDLECRIVSNEDYKKLWIARCDRSHNLLTQTNELERHNLSLLHSNLFLYGASEDLKILYFENSKGDCFEYKNPLS